MRKETESERNEYPLYYTNTSRVCEYDEKNWGSNNMKHVEMKWKENIYTGRLYFHIIAEMYCTLSLIVKITAVLNSDTIPTRTIAFMWIIRTWVSNK